MRRASRANLKVLHIDARHMFSVLNPEEIISWQLSYVRQMFPSLGTFFQENFT